MTRGWSDDLAGGLAIQIAAASDKETAADTSALSGVDCCPRFMQHVVHLTI